MGEKMEPWSDMTEREANSYYDRNRDREITALRAKLEEATATIKRQAEALERADALLDGLDANHDGRDGLTMNEWDERVEAYRRARSEG